MNDNTFFLAKVIVLSALVSLLIKFGGPLLPIATPYTQDLNGLVTAIVVLPSLTIGVGLLMGLRRSSQKSSR